SATGSAPAGTAMTQRACASRCPTSSAPRRHSWHPQGPGSERPAFHEQPPRQSKGPMSTPVAVLTGDRVVQELPWRWRVQGSIFLIGGLGFMFDAWDVTLNGFLIPLLSKEWGLTPGQAAWIGTANLIGMAVGAFAWGSIADIIGRKKAFALTLLIFSIFTVLGAVSNEIVL